MTNYRDLVWEKGMEKPEWLRVGQRVEVTRPGSQWYLEKGTIVQASNCGDAAATWPAMVSLDFNSTALGFKTWEIAPIYDITPDKPIPVKSILDLAKERNQSRSDGYGDRESFPAIKILWKAYLSARFGVDLDLTDADTADMLLLFKEGRKITRRNAGQYKKDDNVDQAGYVDWSSRLEEMGNG